MRCTFFLLLALFAFRSNAQIGLKTFYYIPTGTLGGVMKKNIGFELMRIGDHTEDNIRYRIGLSYVASQPRQDTFPTVSYIHSNGQTTIYPGYVTYRNFNAVFIIGGMDFTGWAEKDLVFYPGFDVCIGGYGLDYTKKTGWSEEESAGGFAAIGVRPRVGLIYHVNDRINLNLEGSRSFNLLETTRVWTSNEIGFMFQYIF